MINYNAYIDNPGKHNDKKFCGSTKIGTYKGLNKEEFKKAVENDVPHRIKIKVIE